MRKAGLISNARSLLWRMRDAVTPDGTLREGVRFSRGNIYSTGGAGPAFGDADGNRLYLAACDAVHQIRPKVAAVLEGPGL